MRAIEFAIDKDGVKTSKSEQSPASGLNLFSDGAGWSNDYTLYRLGLALAMTDGKITPDINPASWVGQNKTAHPYSKEEQDMLERAYEAVGAIYKDLTKGDKESKELPDTNTRSPVTSFKGYPR